MKNLWNTKRKMPQCWQGKASDIFEEWEHLINFRNFCYAIIAALDLDLDLNRLEDSFTTESYE